MRLAVIAVLVLVLMSAAAAASQDRRAVVSVAITTVDVRETSSARADTLLLWNRNERSRPIGHGVKACLKIGSGGLLGGGVMTCNLTISLPLGKLTATGTIHSVHRYTLIITGGTGVYEGVTGPLFVRRIAQGVRNLTFSV